MENSILKKGYQLLSVGDYRGAQIAFKFVCASSSYLLERATATQGLGISLYFQQNFEAAVYNLEKSLLVVKDRRSFALLVQGYIILGDLEKAAAKEKDYEDFCGQYNRILIKDEIGRHAVLLGYSENVANFFFEKESLDGLNDFQVLLLNSAVSKNDKKRLAIAKAELKRRSLESLLNNYQKDLGGLFCNWEDIESGKYENTMIQGNARLYESDDSFYNETFAAARLDGLVAEFGVYKGEMLRRLAAFFDDQEVFGFDSFKGLPTDWGEMLPKDHFCLDSIPQFEERNIELRIGLFQDTLPIFQEDIGSKKIKFAHVDCDLYSSTSTVLQTLKNNFTAGSIILFDEYYNYKGWMDHEYRAFQELVEQNDLRYEYVGIRNAMVAVRLL